MELPKYHKSDSISNWKKRGLIYHNFDELYEVYIKTMNCQHCGKEFLNKFDRCLDHDHETGMFRKIVCRGCNSHDTYINNPTNHKYYNPLGRTDKKILDKSYREKNREKINNKQKEKITCECGSTFSRSEKSKHKRTMKHLDWFMNYVD